ncbi:ATP phosphoribosyltransferase regulatory subunit [Pseudooceanicola sp. CBS1P-1]|uniref:ATP phosphoribosyltransferase regulatory subunit n=1 Tax=Pseudooceanicola albus TaxID=2692189 RepID=A0A6L7GBG0_9RHOB|nr:MULTISPECIES: ATP phosphoribosyltransferase regulatory subunit [Pseudooceanicola]MBT9386926.1 ATP phosphoribosyltransferase regulatory subunit [Pseudooceanicola endophyticus]MXN21032.1 ATP phosphoribosyltransferase regulatory subunit [Pseudooceanicola albus]
MAWLSPEKAQVLACAAALRAEFEAAGAVVVEAPILVSAGDLLDLYGEDLRARAYTTSDTLRGEQMLRPDFTVPVVEQHMKQGAEPARYTYSGEVFRRQEEDEARANEYVQVGFEIFDGADPAAADAEVFARLRTAVAPLGLKATMGDIGILMAAVEGLNTSEARKAALRRHLWRPARFKALVERYSGRSPMPAARKALLASRDPLAGAGPEIGLRSLDEVVGRIEALRADAALPPIPAHEVELLEALLSVRETLPHALEQLRDIAVDMPAIVPAVDRLGRRMQAMAARGIDIETLEFEAAYGRTHMEYYDGFVFGFVVEGRPDLPAVASGGRYDALTREVGRRLGRPEGIPAVGGIIRPGMVLELGGRA